MNVKKFTYIGIWAGIAAACLALAFVFFLEFKTSVVLKKELTQKKEELRDAQKASRKLQELEQKSDELQQREEKLKRQVARGEYRPFDLIRAITRTATKVGLRDIRFEILPGGPAAGGAIVGVTEVSFKMTCEATFAQLLDFLKALTELERIVTVRVVDIRRQPQRIPYQAVIVTLSTYTFPE